MDVRYQRRLAASILKCGVNRVYIDPYRLEDVVEAVTREDVRRLIKEGAIRKKQKKGISRGRARKMMEQRRKGRRRGPGSRKGAKYARYPRKRRWINTIRPLRRTLKMYRDNGIISPETYRKYYRHAGGGVFRSVAHMNQHLAAEGAFLKPPESIKEV
ncbi:MAG: 50S ribosomal protein L19e [Thermoplasmata archaeon]|nr:50S ribosomal protein L19e [Thermoplasmata archaeon]